MAKNRMLVRDQYELIAHTLRLEESFVRQCMLRLKSDDRVAATRPIASPVTPLHLARMIMGLCAPIPSRATEIERRLGKLPKAEGAGVESAELELGRVIADTAGAQAMGIDFRKSHILFGVTNPIVQFSLDHHGGETSLIRYQEPGGGGWRGLEDIRILTMRDLRTLVRDLIKE